MGFLRTGAWLTVFALCAIQASGQAHVASCSEDVHIDTAQRNAIDSVAMEFFQTVLGPNPSTAFDYLSKDGQSNTTQHQLNAVSTSIGQFGAKNVTLQHTYLIELIGNSPGRVVCATDFSKPDGWESVAAKSVLQQAHVLMSADTRNNQLALTAWLIPERNQWKVEGFWVNVSALAGQDSMRLLEQARAQQTREHNFNAALLYAAAGQIANRGPNFQLGIAQSISNDSSKLAVPLDIKGPPPFSWKDEHTIYKVINVGPIAVGGKIYVVIVHEVSPWQSDAQVDGWNRELLGYFKHRFPEYSDSFAGLVARAIERGSTRGYGTVEELSPAK